MFNRKEFDIEKKNEENSIFFGTGAKKKKRL
jgi:hypothetical protein